MILNRLAAILPALAILALLAGPLEAGTRKGDRFLRDGRVAEGRKEFDKALALYEQALSEDPMDAAYQMAVNRVRFQAGQTHVTRGRRLREAGNLEGAVVEFQKAFAIDPASTIAEQELRQTNQMLDAEKRRKETPGAKEPKPEDRGVSPTQMARREAEQRAAAMKGVPFLKPLKDEITNLRIVNQSPKVLFETIGKLAGINVLFDADYTDQGKRYSLDLARTTLTEALDYTALLSKSFWKPLSDNTIFITVDNVTKRRDYEEHVSRVFYLQNITSPQELQEVMTAVRQVTDVRKVFPVNSQSALIIRGTADQMALAEKVILDLDKPKPEVVVDVMVFETARSVTRELGLLALTTGGINVPVNFTPQGGATGTGGTTTPSIALNRLKDIGSGDFTVTLPGASLQAMLSDGRTKILQSPQVRATDGQKAMVKIGERFPYASGSFQSALGGVGGFPAAQTQFQFADVGVNVDLTPRIHGSDEVSMQIMLEISNIRERINVGGVEQPVIGQRRVEHIIRVKEGEATLIGGLMQASDRLTRSGIPGLMQIPGLGRLLSYEKVERSDNDLLVVLVPHVVRYPEILPENLKSIASGTETIYKVSYESRTNGAAATVDASPEAAPVKPAPRPALPPGLIPGTQAPKPSTETPEAPPPPGTAPPETEPAGARGGAMTEAPAPAAPVKVVIRPSSTEPMLNALVTVNVNIENAKELFTSPMRLRFDPKVLKLIEVRRGPFMAGDGAQVTYEATKLDDGAIIALNRVAGAGGMSGTGTLVTLLFQATGRGSSEVAFSELTLRDAKLQTIEAEATAATIQVK